jgi:hypothetical protein
MGTSRTAANSALVDLKDTSDKRKIASVSADPMKAQP